MMSNSLADLKFWVSYLSSVGPYALVAAVGLVVALVRWQRHPTASMLAAAGLALTLFNLLLGLGMTVWQFNGDIGESTISLLRVAGTIRGLLGAVALAIVVAAVFVGRREAAPPFDARP